jgi:hypothetical protein
LAYRGHSRLSAMRTIREVAAAKSDQRDNSG